MKLITFLYAYVTSLHRDTKGASAIEYAVIAGLIAVAVIGIAIAIGDDLTLIFQGVADEVEEALPGTG